MAKWIGSWRGEVDWELGVGAAKRVGSWALGVYCPTSAMRRISSELKPAWLTTGAMLLRRSR